LITEKKDSTMKSFYPILFYFRLRLIFILIPLGCFNCQSFYFHPSKKKFHDPEIFGFEKKNRYVDSHNGTSVHSVHIKAYSKETKGIILQFHGNGENQTSHFLSLVWLVNHGYDLVTFDYRGYGNMEGKPSNEDNYKDSLAILNFYHKMCKENNIKLIVYAQSLGGAIAMRSIPDMNDRSQLILTIVDGSFFSYRSVAYQIAKEILWKPFAFIFSRFLSDDHSPENYIEKVSPTPLLIIHGTDDNIVPFSEGTEIFRLAKKPKMFWEIKGGKHLGWMKFGRSENAKHFLKFLNHIIQMDNSENIFDSNQSSEDLFFSK